MADHVLDPAQDDVVVRTTEITRGRGADVGFECAGVQPVFDALLRALRTGGMLQVIALFSERPTPDIGPLLFKEVRTQGSMGYAHDHPTAIRLVREQGSRSALCRAGELRWVKHSTGPGPRAISRSPSTA
ncbi:threonine dehydrogenase-like Zn-dependent dehydrogenase [Streptomyces tendae]